MIGEMKREKILLHCCCAPCSTHCIEVLRENYEPILYFYDPNIEPYEEYIKRLDEVRKYSKIVGVELIEGVYDNERWNEFISGYETEPEGGSRCSRCFEFNLSETARKAEELGIRYITTTLTVSPYKNSEKIFKIGHNIVGDGVEFLETNFKKKDGYKKSIELSKRYKLYRQNYCGCRFSKR